MCLTLCLDPISSYNTFKTWYSLVQLANTSMDVSLGLLSWPRPLNWEMGIMLQLFQSQ